MGLWQIDTIRPSSMDRAGAGLCQAGVIVIMHRKQLFRYS
ncbi:hypothetical protein [Nitrosomonas sp.]|nr:hypothetical protein [Nitrosomonas sp.]